MEIQIFPDSPDVKNTNVFEWYFRCPIHANVVVGGRIRSTAIRSQRIVQFKALFTFIRVVLGPYLRS